MFCHVQGVGDMENIKRNVRNLGSEETWTERVTDRRRIVVAALGSRPKCEFVHSIKNIYS